MGKVAGDLSERGHKQVAEVVPLKRVAGAEAVGEELRQQVFFFAERDHAVAQVAGGQHVEVLAQAAGGAAIVGDGDHRGEIGDCARIGSGLRRGRHVPAQAAQQRGEAGAAADGHHAQRAHRLAGRVAGVWARGFSCRFRNRRIQDRPYGISGYSNSVKRGSSTMLWKSLSARACSRFLGSARWPGQGCRGNPGRGR